LLLNEGGEQRELTKGRRLQSKKPFTPTIGRKKKRARGRARKGKSSGQDWLTADRQKSSKRGKKRGIAFRPKGSKRRGKKRKGSGKRDWDGTGKKASGSSEYPGGGQSSLPLKKRDHAKPGGEEENNTWKGYGRKECIKNTI